MRGETFFVCCLTHFRSALANPQVWNHLYMLASICTSQFTFQVNLTWSRSREGGRCVQSTHAHADTHTHTNRDGMRSEEVRTRFL